MIEFFLICTDLFISVSYLKVLKELSQFYSFGIMDLLRSRKWDFSIQW